MDLQELFKIAGIQPDERMKTVGFQHPRLEMPWDDWMIQRLSFDWLWWWSSLTLLSWSTRKWWAQNRQQIYERKHKPCLILRDQCRCLLAKEGWNPGVLSCRWALASEELQPIIVLNIEDGIAKGSARSIEAVNIFGALDGHRDLFVAFGGHAGA